MTTPRNPSARCDAVLALIDACLAEAGTGRSGGRRQLNTSDPRLARRHLTLVSG
jgi:hypothetical protein